MRVFVTGASGFVGSAVVEELLRSKHEVVGLARSEKSAEALRAMGALAHRGDLEDLASLTRGAAESDAVIHTGFNHDFTKFAQSCQHDALVIDALGTALVGTRRPLVVTSGIGILVTNGKDATEASLVPTGDKAHPRTATERAVQAQVERGIIASTVRLPPSVHGEGDHGFVPILIDLARAKGVSVYAENGANLWPAVHRLDAAKVYARAIEKTEAGVRYHAVDERGVPFREIARAIGEGLGVPTEGRSKEEAAQHFGWFAHFAAMNVPATSIETRAKLGWTPAGPGLLADIANASYFGPRK